MNAELQHGPWGADAAPARTPARPRQPIILDGVELDDRALLVRPAPEPVRSGERSAPAPLLTDAELLSLMDPARLVLDRVPLALLADLVSPFGPDSERIAAEES